MTLRTSSKALLALLVASLFVAACAGGREKSRLSTPTAAAATAVNGCGVRRPAGDSVETLDSGGVKRSYRLHIPRGYDAARPTPLVLNFHGFGSNARDQEAYSRMPAQADAAGFIAVAPHGTNTPRRWYIYGTREPGYVDDFAFVGELIDHLRGALCIDPDRVYATGISNGGGMSSLLGCKLNDRFAAVAPVAGSPFSAADCRGKAPIAVIAFHGTDDRLVPFEGGVGGRLGLALQSVRGNVRSWAEHNGCASSANTERVAADVSLESYGECNAGADVQLYVIEGGGHTWPGATVDAPGLGVTTRSVDATELIWRFFAAHPKQR